MKTKEIIREILFRGKRMDNGEWIFGYYFQKKNPLSEDGLQVKHCISDLLLFGAEVEPKTVGQYTGFKDKNGEKIFEGDIVKVTDKYNNSVIYVIDYFMGAFSLKQKGVDYWAQFNDLHLRHYDFEILGNIHENPELIGDADE